MRLSVSNAFSNTYFITHATLCRFSRHVYESSSSVRASQRFWWWHNPTQSKKWMELLMDTLTDDRPPRRVSRRALLGWGIAAGIAATGTGGLVYTQIFLNSSGSSGSSGRSIDLYTYNGHTQGVNALAWSPDGKYIASGGTDQIVQVWDAITGDHLLTYTGHLDQRRNPFDNTAYPYAITALAWSPDSTRIASGAGSGPVRVWKFST